jgi:hypothetical protein
VTMASRSALESLLTAILPWRCNRSDAAAGDNYIDLSRIDFEALKAKFAKGSKAIEVQKLEDKSHKTGSDGQAEPYPNELLGRISEDDRRIQCRSVEPRNPIRPVNGVHEAAFRRRKTWDCRAVDRGRYCEPVWVTGETLRPVTRYTPVGIRK